jgi:hypothetical protein
LTRCRGSVGPAEVPPSGGRRLARGAGALPPGPLPTQRDQPLYFSLITASTGSASVTSPGRRRRHPCAVVLVLARVGLRRCRAAWPWLVQSCRSPGVLVPTAVLSLATADTASPWFAARRRGSLVRRLRRLRRRQPSRWAPAPGSSDGLRLGLPSSGGLHRRRRSHGGSPHHLHAVAHVPGGSRTTKVITTARTNTSRTSCHASCLFGSTFITSGTGRNFRSRPRFVGRAPACEPLARVWWGCGGAFDGRSGGGRPGISSLPAAARAAAHLCRLETAAAATLTSPTATRSIARAPVRLQWYDSVASTAEGGGAFGRESSPERRQLACSTRAMSCMTTAPPAYLPRGQSSSSRDCGGPR